MLNQSGSNLAYNLQRSNVFISELIMEGTQDVMFLHDIIKCVKMFYETPVIFFTNKDYSDSIFNTLCKVRRILREDAPKTELTSAIVDFHLDWLHAVSEIEKFKLNISKGKYMREDIYESIGFTIDAMHSRFKYFHIYFKKYISKLPKDDQLNINSEIEIVETMHHDVTKVLLEKLKCFRSFDSDIIFKDRINDGIEELATWLDKIYDGLTVQLSGAVDYAMPNVTMDFMKAVQDVFDELADAIPPETRLMSEKIKQKGTEVVSMIRGTTPHDLEISTVIAKIHTLEDRLKSLEKAQSSAIAALTNKKEYLERKLDSLMRLKSSLQTYQEQSAMMSNESSYESDIDFYHIKIFNHTLSPPDRQRLVTELCKIWDIAFFGKKKSVLSILSASDVRGEEYVDEFGTYYADEYGRKIYKGQDEDKLYQLNERDQLVPLTDDDDHIYFYDNCGRYFIDHDTRQRHYKATEKASEYVMGPTGDMLKVKEERDGINYYYDNLGRYYINKDGKFIYRDEDSLSEYENDEFGNLVRIKSQADDLEPCSDNLHVTEDSNYLKQHVGIALKEAIAEVVLHQPADPIKYLAARILKYRENIQYRDELAKEKEALNAEREIIRLEEQAAAERAALEAALLATGVGSEGNFEDDFALPYNSLYTSDASTNTTVKH